MNAIVIEQALEATKLAFEVHQNAVIQRLRLSRAKVASWPLDEDPKAPLGVSFHFKSKQLAAPARVLRVEIAFRMVGAEEEAEGAKREPAVLVECAFEADYLLREGFEATPEQVKAFKDGNAIFNAWPYFREYLQSSLQRMGLPGLAAPFLRLQPKGAAASAGSAQEETTGKGRSGKTVGGAGRRRTARS